MPYRTSPDRVKEILAPGKDYRPGSPLDPAMQLANMIVTQVIRMAPDYGIDPPTTEEAAVMEGWLAAWAYKLSYQQLQSRSEGRSSGSYKGQSGKGFELNNYGVGAMQVDPTGLLASLNNGTTVGAEWLGKGVGDWRSWIERNWATVM